MELTTLIKLGGKEWSTSTMHRVYFNDLAELFGLELTHYKTGSVSSATLRGESISNNAGYGLATTLSFGKLWFDIKKGEFGYKFASCKLFSGDQIGEYLVAEITRRAEAMRETGL